MADKRLVQFYDDKYSGEAGMDRVEPVARVARPVDRFQGAVRTLTPLVKNLDVLELAAGSGRIAQSLADSGFRTWTLSDWAPSRVEGMQRRMASESRFRFAVVDASHPTQSLGGQQFDAIVSIADHGSGKSLCTMCSQIASCSDDSSPVMVARSQRV